MTIEETEEALEQVFGIIGMMVLIFAFIVGYLTSWYVHDQKAEETYHQKLAFCHERMQNGQTRYIWRQEYCGKTLDAVDPISGKHVARRRATTLRRPSAPATSRARTRSGSASRRP